MYPRRSRSALAVTSISTIDMEAAGLCERCLLRTKGVYHRNHDARWDLPRLREVIAPYLRGAPNMQLPERPS
jgi:hypothetical protein